jgi:DNA-binding transcriptional LysR family regulator
VGLNFEDFRWFMCVVRERSVSRAARRIGVTQQAVSERIARLERRVGTPLFIRLSHGMEPTTAAYRLAPYAERALALLDEALVAIDQDVPLRVGVHAPVVTAVVPFLEEALGATAFVLTVEDDADRILTAVAEGVVDVGVGPLDTGRTSMSSALATSNGTTRGVVHPGGPALSGAAGSVAVEQLFSDPVVCVTVPGHPLTTRDDVYFAELSSYHVVFDVWAGGSSSGGSGGTGGLSEEGAVKVCARSTVAGALADGTVAEVAVVDLPPWVVPILIAYRPTDAERPEVSRLRNASRAPGLDGDEATAGAGLEDTTLRGAMAAGGP